LLIKYATSLDLLDREDSGGTVTDEPHARTELLCLDQIGAYGIVARKVAGGSPEFISWGAILGIRGVKPVESGSVV